MHVPIYLFVCFVLVSSFDMALLGIFFSILIRIFFFIGVELLYNVVLVSPVQ